MCNAVTINYHLFSYEKQIVLQQKINGEITFSPDLYSANNRC